MKKSIPATRWYRLYFSNSVSTINRYQIFVHQTRIRKKVIFHYSFRCGMFVVWDDCLVFGFWIYMKSFVCFQIAPLQAITKFICIVLIFGSILLRKQGNKREKNTTFQWSMPVFFLFSEFSIVYLVQAKINFSFFLFVFLFHS